MEDPTPSSPIPLPAAEVEPIPENIPERKKTEKRVIEEDDLEQQAASPTPSPVKKKKKKKKLTGIPFILIHFSSNLICMQMF